MKICIAQLKPTKGEVAQNIKAHLTLINRAAEAGADLIVFPELSLTAYEPELAEALAMDLHNDRLDVFQQISEARKIRIGVGAPIRRQKGFCIGMVFFQPGKARQLYTKTYLHADEEPFFVSGQNDSGLIDKDTGIAPAICYEVFVPEHAEKAFRSGAKVYLASVAKSAKGVAKARERMPEIAKKYGMAALMANCTGYCDNFESAGSSAVWDKEGKLLACLNETEEGILIFDTETGRMAV